jgi:hypothetical protein
MAVYPAYVVGQRLTADLLTSGQMNTTTKLAGQTRTSTITPVADSELVISGVAGTYNIKFVVIYSTTADGNTPGLNTNFTLTGTCTAGYRVGVGTVSSATTTNNPVAGGPIRLRAQIMTGATLTLGYNAANGSGEAIEEFPSITFSTAWTLTLLTAQNTSSATVLTVNAGSYVQWQRIG